MRDGARARSRTSNGKHCIKNAYVDSAEAVLGYRKKRNKEWITSRTWQKIKEKKDLKAKMLMSTKSPRSFLDNLAREAQHVADRGELSTVYKITNSFVARAVPPTDKQCVGWNTSMKS